MTDIEMVSMVDGQFELILHCDTANEGPISGQATLTNKINGVRAKNNCDVIAFVPPKD